jgi:hypothetical protein
MRDPVLQRRQSGSAWAMALCLLLLGPACGLGGPSPFEGALFRVEACDESFRVRVLDQAVIDEADRLLTADRQRIIIGDLRRGTGGFNAPWRWHLDPQTIAFADATIELCDGCPAFVDDELDYWVDTVGRFCPWSTRVAARIR